MNNALATSETVNTIAPAGLKAIGYKVVDICGELYVLFESKYQGTLIFKIIHYLEPTEDIKNVIKDIISGYSAWYRFEGTFFPSPFRVGMIWLGTIKKCIGCSTVEQCFLCVWAAINTVASCFPYLPPRTMYLLTNFFIGLAYKQFEVVDMCPREEFFINVLSEGGVYGQF